ncbi:helix-turn-helix domain-containing protein [Planctomycetota bacterium]
MNDPQLNYEILPGPNGQSRPCPALLTESEAVRYLRLDTVDIADPGATLRRYRDQGLLRATQISKKLFYRRLELDRFIEKQTERNPR